MIYFHILYLNVNEWISVKGCIEVVLSNSVSTSSCDIVVYLGYGHVDPVWSLLLLLRPWIGYGYTGCITPKKYPRIFVIILLYIPGRN